MRDQYIIIILMMIIVKLIMMIIMMASLFHLITVAFMYSLLFDVF